MARTRARIALATLGTALLVTACGSGAGTETADTERPTATLFEPTDTASTSSAATTTAAPTTSAVPTTSAPATTAVPTTPAPTAAPPTQPVVTPPTSAADGRCHGATDPPATATHMQSALADVDGDGRLDALWLYDTPQGTHLHLRTGRGAADDIVLPYGKGAVSVGTGQVDLAVGSAEPGTPQEILAVTAGGDGQRLVGVYGFAIKSGCVIPFQFKGGNPFVYLISQVATRSGLRCVTDGVTGHLEGLTATPAAGGGFATTRQVFKRDGRQLLVATYEAGALPAPANPALLALHSDLTGCSLSAPVF